MCFQLEFTVEIKKPMHSNEFLKYFAEEINELYNSSIEINRQNYKIVFHTLCCDAPSQSFILQTKGHAGFSSCSRCENEVEHLLNRMAFPYTTPAKKDKNYYVGNTSILMTVPNFDVVSDFS